MSLPTLRRETSQLVELANADLTRLWRLIAAGASAEVALRDLLPAIITEYGMLGATLAAEWYDEERVRAEVRGRFAGIPVRADDRGAQALVGWALTEATDDAALRALILGGVQRRIADHVRYTVAESAVRDPASDGWQRVGAGECHFCDMLIGRGAVYSEATADFASHDNCNCSAVPAWGGRSRPVRPYTPTSRNVTDADRARVREYLNANY